MVINFTVKGAKIFDRFDEFHTKTIFLKVNVKRTIF